MNRERQSRRAADAAASWLARLDSSEATPADRRAHEQWLAASSVHREEYAAAQLIFRHAKRVADPELLALAELCKTHWWELSGAPVRGPRLAWAGAFALIACVALSAYWFALSGSLQEFSTGVGETRVVTLADGSVVTLNTDSRLSVPRWWATRRVELERGEAFFAVKHAPVRPFVVAAAGGTVRVLGTQFNVRLDRAGTSVAIVEGRVELSAAPSPNRSDAKQILVAGEAATYEAGRVLKQEKPRMSQLTAWLAGKMVFEGTKLEDLVREVNRYSQAEVKIADAAVNDVLISGTFYTDRIPELLQTLEKAAPVRVIAQDDAILIVAR